MESYPVREQAGKEWKGPAASPRPALPGQARVTQIKGSASENCHGLPLVRLGTGLFVLLERPCTAVSVGTCRQKRRWYTLE